MPSDAKKRRDAAKKQAAKNRIKVRDLKLVIFENSYVYNFKRFMMILRCIFERLYWKIILGRQLW